MRSVERDGTKLQTIASIAVAMCLALLSGCEEGQSATEASRRVEFSERTTVGVDLVRSDTGGLRTEGGVISVAIENLTPAPLRVTHIEAVTDGGLRVTYLGHCIRACQGTGRWGEPGVAEFVMGGIEGTYPVQLLPVTDGESMRRLVFRLEVLEERGISALEDGECLVFRSARFTMSDGTKETVVAFGGRPIAGLWARFTPMEAKGCDAMFNEPTG